MKLCKSKTSYGHISVGDVYRITCQRCRYAIGKPYFHTWCSEELTYKEIEERNKGRFLHKQHGARLTL